MRPRMVFAVVLLAIAAVLAGLAVAVGYGMTAEYGSISGGVWENFGFAMEVAVLGLVPVVVLGLGASLLARRRWVALVAAALPALLVLGVLAATPLAVRHKLAVQFDASPDCMQGLEGASGPGGDAARAAQASFDSIEHVGWFGGGGSSGVGGCDRTMTLVEDVDVPAHYRRALPAAGWRVVDNDAGGVRAERGDAAFEVRGSGRHWVVWTGPRDGAPGPTAVG